ncbi:MAG: DUF1592 domain-containing protein [Verrucomicrobiaceae bacterium]|nr:DUF1592 domain-containing protein [Verrucomicrobiaceae bacterium]
MNLLKRKAMAVLAIALCSSKIPAAEKAASAIVFPGGNIVPFIQENCARCHGPEKQKGKLRLDTLPLEINNNSTAQRWQDVLDALNAGDMPPEDENQPTKKELTQVLATLTNNLRDARRKLSDQGREVAMRKLNRREYVNSIESLFGFRINPEILPEDDPADPYDTIGSQQFFSSYHFGKYLDAARQIVADAFLWGNKGRQELKTQVEEPEIRANKTIRENLRKRMDRWREVVAALEEGKTWKDEDFPRTLKGERFDGRELHFYLNFHAERSSGPQAYLNKELIEKGLYLTRRLGGRWSVGITKHGYDPRATYTIRILAGINEEPPESRSFVSVNDKGRVLAPLKIYGTAHENEMIEVSFKPLNGSSHFGFQLQERRNEIVDGKRYVKKVDPYGDWSSIFVDRMEVEGPFYGEPTFFDKIAFPGGPAKKKNQVIERTDEEAKSLIASFVHEAFRRREIDPRFLGKLHALYEEGRKTGLEAEQALVDPLAVVLASPGFLYLSESEEAGPKRQTLSQRELAVRLSYFLWSAPPDELLYQSAEKGNLKNPGELTKQVNRMLADTKAEAFFHSFISQWFELHRFDDIAVNPDEYLMFDEQVRYSAREEPIRFFQHLVKENLSLGNLIDSDFAMLDPLLAHFYGIKGVDGQGFRKVNLPPESPRGGLIGTTAFMLMGSTGDRTSPIIRGTLVLDKFLHDPSADPPPNVPELTDASKEPLPVREMIELHQSKAQCASCHAKIDPIGYGLETFDAVGLWREEAKIGKRMEEINQGGTLPGGKAYENFEQFKSLLMENKEKLARSLVEGSASYGLGRTVEFSDGDDLDTLTRKLMSEGLPARSLIHNLVQSSLFQTK